jgi:hypothetical protein
MRRAAATTVALLIAVAAALLPVHPASATQGTVAGGAASSWQTNAAVRAIGAANGTVYVGGDFTSVRPPGAAPGTGETARSYLAAFNSATGNLLSFNHTFDAPVLAIVPSPDGRTVYVGGAFGTVDGASRPRLAAFDTTTGALLSWRPRSNSLVTALAIHGNTLYLGGSISILNGQARTRLGAVTADTASLLPWAPTADHDVHALAVAKDGSKVFVGGRFSNLNGAPHHAVGSLHPTTGAVIPFPAESAVPPITASCESYLKDLTVDQTTVYAAAVGDGGGCFDGTFAANVSDGTLKWRNDCLGATETVEVIGAWVYKGSHAHDCSRAGGFPELRTYNNGRGGGQQLLAQDVNDGSLGPWYPDTNSAPPTNVGPLAMATDGQQLFVGGDFTTVNGVAQQGFTRFQPSPDTARPTRPSFLGVASVKPGTVKVTFPAGLDIDDEDLTYRLYRDGGSTPIRTWSLPSTFWQTPSVTWEDTGLAPGSSHFYQLEIIGGPNAVRTANSPTVTVASATASYRNQARADFPSFYWRLGESSGTTAADDTGQGRTGTYQSGTTLGQPGALSGDPNTAVRFNGSTGRVTSNSSAINPQTFSVEAWFRTTTTTGGKLIGFGNSQTGTSSRYDRHVYMTNAGRLIFGVSAAGARTITTPGSYNDGNWHHVVGTMSPSGLRFYVDGVLIGTNSTTYYAETYDGYWRVGGDNLSGWPSRPTSNFFNGTIDEVAVYSTVLPASSVTDHFNAR